MIAACQSGSTEIGLILGWISAVLNTLCGAEGEVRSGRSKGDGNEMDDGGRGGRTFLHASNMSG